MAKPKRRSIAPLTQTHKKSRENKMKFIEEVREAVKTYETIFLLEVQNNRNHCIQEARRYWKNDGSGRFMFGKHTLMGIALGRSSEDELKPEMHKIHMKFRTDCCLFMTNEPIDKVIEWFGSFVEEDHARAGCLATFDVKLEEGPMPQFTHSMEPFLSKLGLPVKLVNGVVHLRSDYTLCEKDAVLTPEQCRLLKLMDIKMTEFRLIPVCYWHNDTFTDLE